MSTSDLKQRYVLMVRLGSMPKKAPMTGGIQQGGVACPFGKRVERNEERRINRVRVIALNVGFYRGGVPTWS